MKEIDKKIIDEINQKNLSCQLIGNQNWYKTYCIYCDDKTRKNAHRHGHFYMSRYFNFGHCFRCGTRVSLTKFLSHFNINFNSRNAINFYKLKKDNIETKHINSPSKLFIEYITMRLGYIDCLEYKLLNDASDECVFYDYFDNKIISRYINRPVRYKKHSSGYYFFQNPFNEYTNLIICEGPFDAIKLHQYFHEPNSLFVSINGKQYSTATQNILDEFNLNIERIYIILDNDIKTQIKKTWHNDTIILKSFFDDPATEVFFL